MAWSKEDLKVIYRKRARNCDFTANLYYLIGYRERAHRRLAVEAFGFTFLAVGQAANTATAQKGDDK